MENLRLNLNLLIIFVFFVTFLSSCNNEELYVSQIEEQILEEENEETPKTVNEIFQIEIENDVAETFENVPLEINILENDSSIPVNFTVTSTSPQEGSLEIIDNDTPNDFSDDSILYSPNPGYSGADSFEYTICDVNSETENCATARVDITINEVFINDEVSSELKAFPTAYGAGAYATGGRGGTVIHVTNLNSSGTGSLREALLTKGARYVVFNVSGVINLSTQIILDSSHNDLTVNGFSAPYGGITIIGSAIRSNGTDNMIWRGIKFRNGYKEDEDWSNETCLGFRASSNIIVDRCSFSYGKSKGFSAGTSGIGEYASNITIQNCLFGESLEAILVGNSAAADFGNASVLRNVMSQVGWRHPKAGGAISLDVINNIVHNWKNRIIRMDGYDFKLNIIGNYFQGGPNTTQSNNPEILFTMHTNTTMKPSIWDEDNFIDAEFKPIDYPSNPASAWDPFWKSTVNIKEEWFSSKRLPLQGAPPIIYKSSSLKEALLAKVGACEYFDDNGDVRFYRDKVDLELINLVDIDSDKWYTNSSLYETMAKNLVDSTPSTVRSDNYDSDRDGMSDSWEIKMFRGLTMAPTGDHDNDGYTNIEEFLNTVDSK